MFSAILLGVRGLFASSMGRIVAAVMAGFLAWQINNALVAKSAVKKHVSRSIDAGKKINAKARKARAQARANPNKHVRCRDC